MRDTDTLDTLCEPIRGGAGTEPISAIDMSTTLPVFEDNDTIQVLESMAGSNGEVLEWTGRIDRSLRVAGSAITNTGVRDLNEDAYLVWPEHQLALVADGMGGQAAGEVASGLAVEVVRDVLFGVKSAENVGAARAHLEEAFQEANSRIFEAGQAAEGLEGMGTTALAVWLIGSQGVLVHAGDSRCYRLRHGHLQQLSDDQSLVAELVRAGMLTPEQAAEDGRRHIVLQSLGSKGISPQSVIFDVQPGDRLLLCTDGLSDMVGDLVIQAYLAAAGPPTSGAKRLVNAALMGGGHDNITVIVIHILGA